MNDLEKATVNEIIGFSGRLSQERIMEGAIPEKIQTGGVEDILFRKAPLEILDLSLYPTKIRRKKALNPGNSANLCDTPWKFQSQKPRAMEIPH